MNEAGYRRERLDRGIKVRTDDIFALSSYREILYLTLPRLAAIAALLVFPLLKGVTGIYWQNVVLTACTIALLALSWDLLHSVGLVSLGQAIFFGAGAYATGFFSQHFGWPPLVTIPLATAVGAIFCTVLLYPVLRLRGIYFALITFAMPLLLTRVIEATKILGGNVGMSGLPPLSDTPLDLYLIITVMLICVFGFRRLFDTDYGLVLKAIRENDRSVMAAGFDLQWYRTQAVFIAAIPGAFAGAFLTHYYQFAGLPAFSIEYSILPLASAIVGGPGSFSGVALGAFMLVPLSEALRSFGNLRVVIYSIVVVVFIVILPEGVFNYLQRKYYQIERLVPMEEGGNGQRANIAGS
ncbi:MAG: branched-chain amino acid ABC transporter permease [Clostridia bacterium]|nr:MAG: branched-chain amino acid ABC transporter permease [Clostridia bacterium]